MLSRVRPAISPGGPRAEYSRMRISPSTLPFPGKGEIGHDAGATISANTRWMSVRWPAASGPDISASLCGPGREGTPGVLSHRLRGCSVPEAPAPRRKNRGDGGLHGVRRPRCGWPGGCLDGAEVPRDDSSGIWKPGRARVRSSPRQAQQSCTPRAQGKARQERDGAPVERLQAQPGPSGAPGLVREGRWQGYRLHSDGA